VLLPLAIRTFQETLDPFLTCKKLRRLCNLAVYAGHCMAALTCHVFLKRTQCNHTICVIWGSHVIAAVAVSSSRNVRWGIWTWKNSPLSNNTFYIVPNTEWSASCVGPLWLTACSPSRGFIIQTTAIISRYFIRCGKLLPTGCTTGVRFSTGANFSFRFYIELLYLCLLHQVLILLPVCVPEKWT